MKEGLVVYHVVEYKNEIQFSLLLGMAYNSAQNLNSSFYASIVGKVLHHSSSLFVTEGINLQLLWRKEMVESVLATQTDPRDWK